jgi:hypothetical protein
MSNKRTIVVAGALANKPHNGGNAWVVLSWVRGFQLLGFDVVFVEQVAPSACVDEQGLTCAFEASTARAFFREVVAWAGLEGSASLVYEGGPRVEGIPMAELLDRVDGAELLVNLSGHLRLPPLLRCIKRRAYVDLDPGYTQAWLGIPGFSLGEHDLFFSVGERLGMPDCSVPCGGISWQPIRQPVVLVDWPVIAASAGRRFTTVASWRGPFGPVTVGGRTLGGKHHEFRRLSELPRSVSTGIFEAAVDVAPADEADRANLVAGGWQVIDPRPVAANPEAFRNYVQDSDAECSAAQAVYVHTRCGWFSDRTARYLASGKPALVQATGFEAVLPIGQGLVTFTSSREAAVGAERIMRDYRAHSEAAREIAERFFDSDIVLGRLADQARVAA